ncbi:MAG: cobalamin-dependent protein [Dehalococcoidia bacterium]|nr:cobalamin-dependent protein [Dehalococcoidia bacterium]
MSEAGSLAGSISELEAELALEQVKASLGRGDDPVAVLTECRQGLDEVGKKFESGEYFIADLVYAASIFKTLMDMLGPELKKTAQGNEKAGKVAIATVKDDIHDIGKNLVAAMLEAAGFEILDLGVDVPSDMICKCIGEQKPDIVALSCLLTTTVDSMESIIAEISKAGARNQVKILVGGIPLSPGLAVAIGADAYGASATEAVTRCRELVGGSGK